MPKLINLEAFKNFLKSQSAGGIILICCVILSLIIANSGWGSYLENLLTTEIGYHSDNVHLKYSILLWINDGLMAIFFLLVGLEIKRELIEGELSSTKKALLPIFAAIGGMLVPAAIYSMFNAQTDAAHGWGVPMATDIAFAIAILSVLGSRVPLALKVFLTALAIVDDLGAIIVVAVFYTSELHTSYLPYIVVLIGVLAILNYFNVKQIYLYLIPGVFLWYFVHSFGVHATIAGVITAFFLPTTPTAVESPLERLEHLLAKPVNFLIMPLFAFANTNIKFEPIMLEGIFEGLSLGIILGLFLGKPIGITLLSYLAVKLRICALPEGTTWKQIYALGILGGIGFTMSIFIALLSFKNPEYQVQAKFSILIASTISGLAGFLLLRRLSEKDRYNEISDNI